MNSSESGDQVVNKPAAEQATEKQGCKHQHGKCGSATLYISIAALVLALYAVVASRHDSDTAMFNDRFVNVEASLASLNGQLATLGKDLEASRGDMVHNQLKAALRTIQEIGDTAKGETRDAIAEIEQKLEALTSTAPSETQAPVDEAAPAAAQPAAPADATASPAEQADPAQQPQ